jgi:hypothetical protein
MIRLRLHKRQKADNPEDIPFLVLRISIRKHITRLSFFPEKFKLIPHTWVRQTKKKDWNLGLKFMWFVFSLSSPQWMKNYLLEILQTVHKEQDLEFSEKDFIIEKETD